MAPVANNVDITVKSISPYGLARATIKGTPLSEGEMRKTDGYFRASLYLCLGMLYLRQNPLLIELLEVEHLKARLLGHWGSDAGQIFTYIYMNRLPSYCSSYGGSPSYYSTASIQSPSLNS